MERYLRLAAVMWPFRPFVSASTWDTPNPGSFKPAPYLKVLDQLIQCIHTWSNHVSEKKKILFNFLWAQNFKTDHFSWSPLENVEVHGVGGLLLVSPSTKSVDVWDPRFNVVLVVTFLWHTSSELAQPVTFLQCPCGCENQSSSLPTWWMVTWINNLFSTYKASSTIA